MECLGHQKAWRRLRSNLHLFQNLQTASFGLTWYSSVSNRRWLQSYGVRSTLQSSSRCFCILLIWILHGQQRSVRLWSVLVIRNMWEDVITVRKTSSLLLLVIAYSDPFLALVVYNHPNLNGPGWCTMVYYHSIWYLGNHKGYIFSRTQSYEVWMSIHWIQLVSCTEIFHTKFGNTTPSSKLIPI